MKKLNANNQVSKFILFSVAIILGYTSQSQKNFKPGYVITGNNDTVKGSIDLRNWEQNPKKIIFKKSGTETTATYTPVDILKFAVSNEQYESGIVQVDKGSDKIQDLTYSQQFSFTTDTIFLRTLVDGAKTLLHYKDTDGKEHFFIKGTSGLELLLYKTYLKNASDGTSGIATDNAFLKQLSLYLSDCPSIQSKLSDLKYSESALTKIFEDYKVCTNTAASYKRKEKTANLLGVTAGVSSTTVKFSGAGFPYLTTQRYPASTNLAAGAFYILNFGIQQKWSLYDELLYTSFKANGYYKESYQGEDIYDTYTFDLNYSYLSLKTMLRFTFPLRTVSLYVNAGVSNGIAVIAKNRLVSVRKTYSQVSTVESEAIKDGRKYEQALIAGVGARLKKFSIEARGENGNGMSNYGGLSSKVNRFFVMLGYSFSF